MTTCTWAAAQASYFDPAAWVGNLPPRPGDTAILTAGDALIAQTWPGGETVILAGAVTNTPTLDLGNITIAANTSVGAVQGGGQGCIDITGRTTNQGTLAARDYQPFFGVSLGGTLDVDIGTGVHRYGAATAQLINTGTLEADHHSTLRVDAVAAGNGLVNDGSIVSLGHTVLNASVTGTGVVELGAVINIQSNSRALGLLEVDRGIGAGQSIVFAPGAELQINDLPGFHAVVHGFGYDAVTAQQGFAESIELTGADITALRYDGTAAKGVLSLWQGTSLAGRISFAGSYGTNSFMLWHEGTSTVITAMPV